MDNTQLTLDDAMKVKGPDRWEGNTYIHYGIRYGVQMLPKNATGEYPVRTVKVNSEDELENK